MKLSERIEGTHDRECRSDPYQMRLNQNVSHFDIAGEPSGPTLVKLTVHAVISYISFWPTY